MEDKEERHCWLKANKLDWLVSLSDNWLPGFNMKQYNTTRWALHRPGMDRKDTSY